MFRSPRPFLFGGALSLTSLLLLPPGAALATRCMQHDLSTHFQTIQPIPLEERVRAHQPGDPRTPPVDPGVGDAWLWYTWKLAGFPTAEQKLCTVRGEGTHVYIVVEDSQWQTRVFQDDVDRMVQMWDQESLGNWPTLGIYDLDIQNFGPCPDELDNDPKVYVLYYDFDVNADGFFWFFDQYPDGTQQFESNECEVLYMNSSDFDPGGDYLIAVQAHEFQHMLHWLADDDELTWLNEGCSELAMWLFGRPDDVVSFPSVPDNNLTSWSSGFADYVKVYLWTLYLYEHFGGQATILNLVSQISNSTTSVQSTLQAQGYTETVAQVVRDWTTANFLDDPALAGGKYNYAGEDLPTFSSVLKSAYPVPSTNANVNHYAADYVKFINGVPQRLFFDGGDTSDWAVRVIPYLAGVPLSVEDVALDGVDAGFFDLPQFGTAYDQVILQVTNVSSAGLTSYQYRTEAEPASVGGWGLGEALALRVEGANPSRAGGTLRLQLAGAGTVEVSLFDATGKRIRTLAAAEFESGFHDLHWDGRDDRGNPAPAGIYYARAAARSGSANARLLLLP